MANQFGTYGTRGQPASGNIPGARSGAVSWTDAAGNFWLFGGTGNDSVGTAGPAGNLGVLNDLWKYNPGTDEWTWVGGSNLANQTEVYGTMGTAAPSDIPGRRFAAVAWTDANGNIWLFGGMYWISTGPGSAVGANYGDLWEYSPGTNEWAWMAGSNQTNPFGIYGTERLLSSGNAPGARFRERKSVAFWRVRGKLKFRRNAQRPVGVQRRPMDVDGRVERSLPGWRRRNSGNSCSRQYTGRSHQCHGWTDKQGNLWLFGGLGTDSTGAAGWLSDLWEYQP